jgi:hypothetical protein
MEKSAQAGEGGEDARNSFHYILHHVQMVGSLKMNTTLEYSTRVVQEGDRRCKKSTLNDLAYLTLLRIPLMNPVKVVAYAPDEMADTLPLFLHYTYMYYVVKILCNTSM